METIEIEVSYEKKITVQLPAFKKGSCFAYAVRSDERCMQVNFSTTSGPEISFVHTGLAFKDTDNEVDITEDEFLKIYDETKIRIESLARPSLLTNNKSA